MRWSKEEKRLFYARLALKINDYQNKRYIKSITQDVDKSKYLKIFDNVSTVLRDKLVNYSIESLATAEAGERANQVLLQLGLNDSKLDTQELHRMSILLLKLQIFYDLTNRINIPKSYINKVINRYLARLLPLKDNIQKKDIDVLEELTKYNNRQNKNDRIGGPRD